MLSVRLDLIFLCLIMRINKHKLNEYLSYLDNYFITKDFEGILEN